MNKMIKIITGQIQRAIRAVLYGVEGIGKTTFASHSPYPLFIDLEGGSDSMNVRRTQRPQTWIELLQVISEIINDQSLCSTLIIDTIDRAEKLCIDYICKKYDKNGIEDFGYGKGYTYLREEFQKLLIILDQSITSGINVLILAHSQIRKFELPGEAGAYDRYELKMAKSVCPLIKEWADILLFADYETFLISDNSKYKPAGGKRVMYAEHALCWDAKNRYGLPEKMDLDYQCISHLFVSPAKRLKEMMSRYSISADNLQKIVSEHSTYPADKPWSEYDDLTISWIIQNWDGIVSTITTSKENNNSQNGGIRNE